MSALFAGPGAGGLLGAQLRTRTPHGATSRPRLNDDEERRR